MCGISGIVGTNWSRAQLEAMIASQQHRGPDDTGTYYSDDGLAALGQNRLSIIDLSSAGHQPMSSADGRYWLTFNGEIYNYIELRAELSDYPYRSGSDTEVLLAAYSHWGVSCLDKLIGMFSFFLWDTHDKTMLAVRDRFGVKPLHYAVTPEGALLLSSEIKALHAAGIVKAPNVRRWASYLANGAYETDESFWENVNVLPAGHWLRWQDGGITIRRWYDLADHVGDLDMRSDQAVQDEYLALLENTIRLRFRSDVPVGISVSGGLDSSTLLGLIRRVQGEHSQVYAYTFVTGDPNYDELFWVQQLLAQTRHISVVCPLSAADVPELALSVQAHEDEPFGGLPTLAYARVFERARADGTIVLLDGQGVDEAWAGYDYYERAANGTTITQTVQGTHDKPVRPDCLMPDFAAHAETITYRTPFADALRNTQYRDVAYTKIPRALRFNDRVSMRSSCELREPFLDHRLFELAFRQPTERKIRDGVRKWLPRQVVNEIVPKRVSEAPKRPLQTPQREWLRGELRGWAADHIESAIATYGGTWLNTNAVRAAWDRYCAGESDNSFYVWQWISLSLIQQTSSPVTR